MSDHSQRSELPDLAPLISQALLDPHSNMEVLNQACDAALYFGFSGLCTNLTRIPTARQRLGPQGFTKLIAVIGFPFGAIPNEIKVAEVEWAAAHGAEEIDVVPDFFSLSQKRVSTFAEEIASLCERGLPVNVVLDMARLSTENLAIAVDSAIDAGAHCIQSGNGFGPAITPSEIRKLVDLSRGRCGIKAVGRLQSLDQALQLIEAGATHLGTSRGPELMQELRRSQR